MTLTHKNYNPCGDLTGSERAICDEALTKYFDLPFVQVMRNVVLEHWEEGIGSSDKIIDWATRDLNDIERQVFMNFDDMTTAQVGLYKYFIHLLFENRYNIFYNRLVDFCAEENISIDDKSERLLESIAQKADYYTSLNTLTENFRYALIHGGT